MSDNHSYIKSKKLLKIFEILLGKIYFEKPENVIEAIICELKKLETQKNQNHIFSKDDAEAMFRYVDIENKNFIDKEKCLLGLNQFVLNNKQKEHIEKMEIASTVDLETFTSYVNEIANL